jgi:hypothetical protein
MNWNAAQRITALTGTFRLGSVGVGQNDDFDGFACVKRQVVERQGSVLRQSCLNSVRL